MNRTVCWFSHGAASTIAAGLTLAANPEAIVVCIDTGSEHPDNERYRKECADWFGQEIVMLRSADYADIWDVFERTRYLVGVKGARCTTELKKKVRHAFELPTDHQVFGYTADKRDAARAARFIIQNPGVDAVFPLVERGITKGECLTLIEQAGIALPEMYRLGYSNNNCVGCVKGGMGYWNKIREDFPDVFARMSKVERKLGRSVLRPSGEPLFLDQLERGRGKYEGEELVNCDLDCQMVADELSYMEGTDTKEGDA